MAISSQAIAAGEAFVRLVLDDQQFASALGDWETNLRSLGRRMSSFGTGMAALAGPVAGVFAVGVRNLLTFSNQLALMESRLGIAGEELGQLASMARLTGTSMEALEIGLKTIGERLIQLQAGGEEVTNAFALARINLEEFVAASETDRFFMLADGIASISDAQVQAGVALRIFGEAGNRLLPLFNLIRELGPEAARELVASISPSQRQIDAARQLDLQWQFFRLSLANATAEMAVNLLPVMLELLSIGVQFTAWVAEWSQGNEELVATIGVVAFAMLGLSVVLKAFSPLITPLIRLAAALRPLGVRILTMVGQFRNFSGGLVEVQASLGQVARGLAWVGRASLIVTGVIVLLTESFTALKRVLEEDTWLGRFQAQLESFLESNTIQSFLTSQFGPGVPFALEGLAGLLPQDEDVAFSPAEVRSPPPGAAGGTSPARLDAIGIASQFASAQTLDFAGLDVQRQQAVDISDIKQATEISKNHIKDIAKALKDMRSMN